MFDFIRFRKAQIYSETRIKLLAKILKYQTKILLLAPLLCNRHVRTATEVVVIFRTPDGYFRKGITASDAGYFLN